MHSLLVLSLPTWRRQGVCRTGPKPRSHRGRRLSSRSKTTDFDAEEEPPHPPHVLPPPRSRPGGHLAPPETQSRQGTLRSYCILSSPRTTSRSGLQSSSSLKRALSKEKCNLPQLQQLCSRPVGGRILFLRRLSDQSLNLLWTWLVLTSNLTAFHRLLF